MKFAQTLFIISSLNFSIQLNAQQEEILPVGFTADELIKLNNGDFTIYNDSRGITAAPAFPVRTMAQWEEVQSLVITWTAFPNIQAQMVDAAQEEAEVLIICSDSNTVKSYLNGAGVPLTNLHFLEAAYNSIWVRDYGAHTVYKNNVDSLLLVEWIYNRPSRPDDDALPNFYAAEKGIGLHSTTQSPNDLVNTGGNWMVDGFGTALASKLILDENDAGNPYGVSVKSETQIDNIMQQYMGIDRYIKMETLPYDNIHHIDMHMKFVNEETILMGEYPVGVSDGPQIELNMAYVSTFNSVFGTPYKWVRIPQPPSTSGAYPSTGGSYRTYCNNVIINKTVLVPFYRVEYDTIAQRILQDVYPGYTIVGIDCDSGGDNIIQQSGAIHCISNLIGVDDPLLISHQQLADTYDDVNPYLVDAFITHKTGIASATLYWSLTEGSGYTAVTMTPGTLIDHFEANIPAQAAGTRIYYYIHAQAVNGKQQVRPMPAPAGNFTFEILDSGVSIDENQNAIGFGEIFPNPADVIVWIPVITDVACQGKVDLYDMTGRLVNTIAKGQFVVGKNDIFLDISTLSQGIYTIVLTTGEITKTTKLVVK